MKTDEQLGAVIDQVRGYMDALFEGDVAAFAQVFHPQVRLQSATEGPLVLMDREQYLDLVSGRPSPAAMGQRRTDSIVDVAITSPTTAQAVVLTQYAARHFVDSLNLLHTDGRWWILTKTWHFTDTH